MQQDTMLRACPMLVHLTLTTVHLQYYYYYPLFKDEEAEAQG